MNQIAVIDQRGDEVMVEAASGETLMEILRDNLFDVPAICSGAGTCGTCHLHIEEPWYSQLPPKDSYEQDTLLDSVHYSASHSRLACQITFDEQLNGIRLILVNNS